MSIPGYVVDASYSEFFTGYIVGALSIFCAVWAGWAVSLAYRTIVSAIRGGKEQS